MKTILLTMALTMFAILPLTASADKPILDVTIPSSNKGNSWAEGNLISDALNRMGYDSKVVHTKKCVNNKSYMAKDTGRPAIFVRSASRYVKDESRNCKIEITDDNFLTVFYKRHQTMCVRADKSFTTINDFLSGKTRVTVAVTHSSTDGIFDNLSDQTGVRFVPVKVKGSKNIIKSLVAGDTDLMYSGLTKREIGTDTINCFTTSATTEVGGRTPMNKLFPTWNLNETGRVKYFHAVNIPKDRVAKIKQDLLNLANDVKIKPYLAKTFMTPGKDIANGRQVFDNHVATILANK